MRSGARGAAQQRRAGYAGDAARGVSARVTRR